MFSFMIAVFTGLLGKLNLQSIMVALASAVLSFLVFTGWNQLIDNPSVRNAARADYIAIARFESVEAQRRTVEHLLKLEQAKSREIKSRLAAYQEAGRVLEISRNKGRSQEQALKEELDALEKSNRDGVPLVGSVGVLEFLHNR